MTRTPVFLLCLLCKEMVTSSHIPCNYNNDIQIFRYFPKKKGSHPHPYIKLLFASATTFPQKIIISSLLLCLPNPPKKNAPGIFEINSPALAWQNLFSPTLVRGTCFFRLPTIVLLAQADFLSVFEYIYRIPQYILLIRLITDQISICIYIYIYQYVICQYIPRYKYMLLKSNHESCDMVWLLCLFWGFACIGWHFQTIVCSIRTSPTSEWTPTLGVLEIWNSYIGL